MAKAIAAGIPKMRIEEAAPARRRGIDSGTQTIVGVNKFQVTDQAEIEVLRVDNKTVRESQIAKAAAPQGERDPAAVATALAALTDTARTGAGNLLERAVAAARAKATVGEISDAMEQVWGRHRCRDARRLGRLHGGGRSYEQGRGSCAAPVRGVRRQRRPPPAHPGRQDGPGRPRPRPEGDCQRVRGLGFDVDIGPLFATPDEARAPGGGERRAHPRRVVAGRPATSPWCRTSPPRWRRKAAAIS